MQRISILFLINRKIIIDTIKNDINNLHDLLNKKADNYNFHNLKDSVSIKFLIILADLWEKFSRTYTNLETLYKEEKALEDDFCRMYTKFELFLENSNKKVNSNKNIKNLNKNTNEKIDVDNFIDKIQFKEFNNEYISNKETINLNIEDIKKNLDDLINNFKTKNLATEESIKKIEGIYIYIIKLEFYLLRLEDTHNNNKNDNNNNFHNNNKNDLQNNVNTNKKTNDNTSIDKLDKQIRLMEIQVNIKVYNNFR